MEWEVDSQGMGRLPELMGFRSALHPTAVALRLEASSPELIEARRAPVGFQCQMTAQLARDLAERLMLLADSLEGTLDMTKQ